jgi:hypothetical protein
LLVPDLVAYHGSGTSSAGPPVAALPSSGLVDTGTDGGDSSQVFSMVDVLTVTGSDFAAPWNGPQAAGGAVRADSSAGADGDSVRLEGLTDNRAPIAPTSGTPAAGWMPLDSNAARDAALADWVPSRIVARRPTRQTVVATPRAIGRTSLAWSRPRTLVLQAKSLDSALEEPGALPSLLTQMRLGRK